MSVYEPSEEVVEILKDLVEFELAGVVRYTHYALMVTGVNRISLVDFMQTQASESLDHARRVGELLTGLGGHPRMRVAGLDESHRHAVHDILEESFAHEARAIETYRKLLDAVGDSSLLLEEFAREMISAEETHLMELRKMLRDLE
ncbi:MAG: bacterioferritin [Planctomycetota bacterium]|nr:MAG: bacterioferritin [Planctomycetota bacterium]